MDNTEESSTVLSLCTGYAGLDLGLERAIGAIRVLAYVEIEAFAVANLAAKMEKELLPVAPIWSNLKTFNAEPFRGRIDILTSGYPCQPWSAAGKRAGKEDPRHLYPYIREIIETVRPVYIFFENVEGHLSLGFREVQASLRRMGYSVEAGIFSASEVGAPHQRKRLFILADNRSIHSASADKNGDDGERIQELSRGCEIRDENSGCGQSGRGTEELADPSSTGRKTYDTGSGGENRDRPPITTDARCWPSRPGEPQCGWEPSRLVQSKSKRLQGLSQSGERGIKLDEPNGGGSEKGVVGDTKNNIGGGGKCGEKEGTRKDGERRRRLTKPSRKAEPSVGGSPYGFTDRMDYAELCRSCDNRTDELRLLGNGVVPATAERAFRVLFGKLMENRDE